MQRSVFYSLIQEKDIVGLKKQEGFNFQVDGEWFNVYKSRVDGRVYILDSNNGIAILEYDPMEEFEDISSNLRIFDKAKEKLIESETFEKWKKVREKESYRLACEMFRAYRMAELLREKQKEAVCRERKGNKDNGQ